MARRNGWRLDIDNWSSGGGCKHSWPLLILTFVFFFLYFFLLIAFHSNTEADVFSAFLLYLLFLMFFSAFYSQGSVAATSTNSSPWSIL